jgi:hypothetical protein
MSAFLAPALSALLVPVNANDTMAGRALVGLASIVTAVEGVETGP